jgi:hypothetical protein
MPKLVLSHLDLEKIKILHARGYNHEEIAAQIGANENTVKYYIHGQGRDRLKETEWKPLPEPIVTKRKHHPPVYTNSKSPYGLADEIHSNGRILV